MSKTLGLDLGTNSIGWAIRDTAAGDNQIIHSGVLTFEKGVASEKGIEFPRVQKRTESRNKRRNYQSEKYRKYALLQFLIDHNMCPLTIAELNEWRKYTKPYGRRYPQSEAFINWLRFDFNGDGKPDFHLLGKDKDESYYAFRAFAADEHYHNVYQDNLHVLGRVFYQLVQRRGFKGRDEEEAKTGSDKNGTAGRNDIAAYIDDYGTLGAALYQYQKARGGRIRQRYNLRKDYENELKEICRVHNISDEDYQKLWKAIIWQRPLRTQKGLIGNCIYEPGKKRAPISHPLYEEYRTWIFINNLNIEPPAGIAKADYLKDKIYPLFFKASDDFELKSILTQLKKDGAATNARFKEDTKIVSAKLLKFFNDILGDNWKDKYGWDDINNREARQQKKTGTGYTFEDIWHVLSTFDDRESLKEFAVNKLGLDEDIANKFASKSLKQGYATLSLSAIKKILPYLQRGYIYSQAVYMANLYKVLGADSITDGLIEHFSEETEKIFRENGRQKQINAVVNSLIADELNAGRYTIEDGRLLDDEEQARVYKKIIETFSTKTWEEFTEEEKEGIIADVSAKFKSFLMTSVREKSGVFTQPLRLHDQVFDYLQKAYNLPDKRKNFLWHPSEQENYTAAQEYAHFTLKGKDVYVPFKKKETFVNKHPDADYEGRSLKLLGSPEPISKGLKNPMALKTMHKLKQLVNHLLKTNAIEEDTRIVIEIARELNDANTRKAIEKWNNERERENQKFRDIIREINAESGTTFSEDDKTLVRKIRLWEEQGRICLYTGKPISGSEVFNGVMFDIEHTIPASMSFDSELKNLTLADTHYNRHVKGKLFPTQLPNYEHDATVNGKTYPAILSTMERIFGKRSLKVVTDRKGKEDIRESWKKIEDLQKLYDDWRNRAKFASTKEIKDNCIQRKHMAKMDLDYWKSKLRTFTLVEYNPAWKNSQLRDTQIITKYTLPYLKTVFSKVAVEKGSVVHAFKEIYEVNPPFEKKNRKVHSHHAIDAAILTLIPPFYDRDKILQKYNEQKDRDNTSCYHENPKDWKNFSAGKILGIEHQILINNIAENKTTLPTYKTVRKRGKIVKNNDGTIRVAKGDTIRGQLHKETLFGAIKLPLRNEDGKILFEENGKMKLDEKIHLVIRKPLVYSKDPNSPGYKSLEQIEKEIVDKDLFRMIKQQVEASDFKTALTEGVYMLGKNGEKINKIRRIRCINDKLKYDSAIRVQRHSFASSKDYKHNTLAENGGNPVCLFYKSKDGNDKNIKVLSIGSLAESKIMNDQQYFEEPYYNHVEIGKLKKSKRIPLHAVLKSGIKAIFYKDSPEELLELSKVELSTRMYKMYGFEGDGRIRFKHHLAAGMDTELKKDNKELPYYNADEKTMFLRLTQKQWNFIVEGPDFEMALDGTVIFKI
ncbi:type II CRISPR RNA-guided endonuclease Cas9 [Flavobacterium psychrotrophum]|uniref:type II CRISPR RNA-guided endonuclease Cas9 n=1 Tax=Flavobacterium psychrotrophum TaxID=2294119 RepID=UPI000E30CBAE|nr:type II CRISPR RNA-guided endonuclease Cas9 [Flavobacterium psychrotrophum]